jgi:hypothetical protein
VAGTGRTHRNPWNPPFGNRKKQTKELNCVRVSTQVREGDTEIGGPDIFTRNLPPNQAIAHIQNALSKTQVTQETQVMGVGTTRTGYVIRFRDQNQAETARDNLTWLEKLGNNTKLVQPRFGVVVHRIPTDDFLPLENEKAGINKIMEENEMESKG